MSQLNDAVSARACCSVPPTSSGTACLGTLNRLYARRARPARAITTTSAEHPRQPPPAPAARGRGVLRRSARRGSTAVGGPVGAVGARRWRAGRPGGRTGRAGAIVRERQRGEGGELVARSGPRRRRRAWSAHPAPAAVAGRRSAACRRRPPPSAGASAACSSGASSSVGSTGSVDGASASARATSPSVTTGTSATTSSPVGARDARPPVASVGGSQPAPVVRPVRRATGGTSAGAGSSSGRCRPPVGSFGRRSWLGSSSKRLVTMIGIGDGRGSFSAARTRLRPSSEADERSAGSGRPARSSTDASGPRSADTGIRRPTRADSVATVDRAANGTAPVTASTRISASA